MDASVNIIQSITVILLVAGIIGTLLNAIRLPAVLAFIITGMLIGPGGLKIVSSTESIATIAQLGIIFLLFVLGVELTLPKLKEIRTHSVWVGIIQLCLGIIVFSATLIGIGIQLKTALFLAGALSLSSTTIVLTMLEKERELETVHGRIMMGVLIVQDLALVPLMTFMPLLTGGTLEDGILKTFLWVLLKSSLFLGAVIWVSWKFAPRVIEKIAASSTKEIFVIFIVAFGLLIALLAQKVGLSYAVGAFIAGFALSRSITSRQIIANSLPFRDIFATVFFVSVGMLMNIPFLFTHLPIILLVTVLIFCIKVLTIGVSVYLLKFPLKTIIWTGFSLFQVGEFSFILLETGLHIGTINAAVLNTVTSAIVLTMLLTPLVMQAIPRFIGWIEQQEFLQKRIEQIITKEYPAVSQDWVVIAGYGPIAMNLAQVLTAHGIGFKVIEMNLATVKKLKKEGTQCIFGDASNPEVLSHAGIQEAKVFAVTIPDIRSSEMAIQSAKNLNPNIYCIVRSRYQHGIQALFHCGVDEVVYEEFETSMSFIYSILDLLGDDITDKESYLLLLRENRKALLRTGKPRDDQARYGRFSVFKETKIEWISLPEGSSLIGKSLSEAAIRQKTGVNVLSIIEPDGITQSNPEPGAILKPHQMLVVMGNLEQLNHLEAMLC